MGKEGDKWGIIWGTKDLIGRGKERLLAERTGLYQIFRSNIVFLYKI